MPRRRRAPRAKRKQIIWVPVYTPEAFGQIEIAHVATTDLNNLIGRTVEVTLFDITNSFEHQFIKLYFKIVEIRDGKAYTRFKMHELTRDYIRSLVRRGTSRVDAITDVITKDGWIVRVYVLAITIRRVTSSIKSAIRRAAFKVVTERASELTLDELVREMVLGKLASDVYSKAKKVYPLKKVEIMKSKVIKQLPPLEVEAVTEGG